MTIESVKHFDKRCIFVQRSSQALAPLSRPVREGYGAEIGSGTGGPRIPRTQES